MWVDYLGGGGGGAKGMAPSQIIFFFGGGGGVPPTLSTPMINEAGWLKTSYLAVAKVFYFPTK